jgi:hypothetical protein
MTQYLSPPPMNPLSRLLAGVLAVLGLVAALFFGVFVFAVVLGVGLIGWLLLWIRVWWIRRRLGQADLGHVSQGERNPPAGGQGDVIEGEFTVVSDDKPRQNGD